MPILVTTQLPPLRAGNTKWVVEVVDAGVDVTCVMATDRVPVEREKAEINESECKDLQESKAGTPHRINIEINMFTNMNGVFTLHYEMLKSQIQMEHKLGHSKKTPGVKIYKKAQLSVDGMDVEMNMY
ncbi:hypothetical protein EVAR_94762_1 [Eumeta japonica]|uniref:Uncharacterized protein n=1 Tax=Eumeta variegata TaxID=151549 RepID=A0A4C1UVR5_EUMVA|nr:hypothetical protein EVAR_94762_1 [Eumeta japonica]